MEFDTEFFPDTLEAWQLISIFFCWGAALPPSFLANKPKILVEAGARRLNVRRGLRLYLL